MCQHLEALTEIKQPKARVCEECVKLGDGWVHLRTCQACGVTLCCDSSPTGTRANMPGARGTPSSILPNRGRRGYTVLWMMIMRSRRKDKARSVRSLPQTDQQFALARHVRASWLAGP